MASKIDLEQTQNMEQCYENLIVIDIGANLTNKKYSRDLDSVVQRAKDAGESKLHHPFIYLVDHVINCRGSENNGDWNIC